MVVPDFLHGDPLVPNNPHRSFQAWANDHQAVSYSFSITSILVANPLIPNNPHRSFQAWASKLGQMIIKQLVIVLVLQVF